MPASKAIKLWEQTTSLIDYVLVLKGQTLS